MKYKQMFIAQLLILFLFCAAICVYKADTGQQSPILPEPLLLDETAVRSLAPKSEEEFRNAFEYAAANHLSTLSFTYPCEAVQDIPVQQIFQTLRNTQNVCRYELPEYFVYRNSLSSSIRYSRNELTVTLSWPYTEEAKAKEAEALSYARGVLAGLYGDGSLTRDMTQRQRAQALLRWLIDHAEYDAAVTDCHSAWSIFKSGKGVCDAFTGAYNLLLKLDGIQCRGQNGAMLDGTLHLWTVAVLDGAEVHIDSTWTNSKGDANSYFALTAEEMAKDHVWEGMTE